VSTSARSPTLAVIVIITQGTPAATLGCEGGPCKLATTPLARPLPSGMLGFRPGEEVGDAVIRAAKPFRGSASVFANPTGWSARLTVAAAIAVLLLPCVAQAADSSSFKLVVHPGIAGARIPKAVVASIFLCQVTTWGDGAPIKVLDRSLTSPLRVSFGNEVLGMTTLEMGQYWRRQIARGKVPPSIEESDEQVLAFVAANPGAIAYVAADTATPSSVKVIEID